jgi:predicted nucleic acid-binding protein
MSARQFVDTNILMYAHDASAGAKHERAKAVVEELWRTRSGVVSTQVLQELCVNLRRKAGRPLKLKATRDLIADYLAWQVVVNTGESTLAALDLEERYRISFWDALVVHAAQAAGAEVLYSEDLTDGQEFGAVRVVNPLAQG